MIADSNSIPADFAEQVKRYSERAYQRSVADINRQHDERFHDIDHKAVDLLAARKLFQQQATLSPAVDVEEDYSDCVGLNPGTHKLSLLQK